MLKFLNIKLLKNLKVVTLLCMFVFPCIGSVLFASTIKSRSGNIGFDSNNDRSNEMQLNSNGLGIGINDPSANLHVSGNGIVSGKMSIGSAVNSSSSTLHINGTIGYSVDTLSAGGNVINSAIVLVDSSSGNASLLLPALSSTIGMKIIVKRTSILNDVILSGAGGNIEGDSAKLIASGNLVFFTLINTGTEWVYLNNSEAQVAYTVPSSNMFLWWALEESSGNTISDKAGFGRGGNLLNEHYWSGNSISGPVSSGLYLDDSDDTASYTGASIVNSGYTYALWAKVNFASNGSIVNEPEATGTAGFSWASGNALFHKSAYHQLSDGSYVSTQLNSTLSANTWYHIATTYNGATISVYLNGVKESGNTATSWASSANILLDNPGLTDTTVVSLDELRVYDKALSATEIFALYGLGSP